MTDNLQLTHLVDACRWIGAKGWAPATGGNMSVRQDEHLCWLSESGKDKGSLTTDDFLQVEIATNRAPSGRKPSAETGCTPLSIVCFLKPTPSFTFTRLTPRCCPVWSKKPSSTSAALRCKNPSPGRPRIWTRWLSRSLITTRISTPSPPESPITQRNARLIMVFFCAVMA